MKSFWNECFHFQPTKDTFAAIGSAVIVILLSFAMCLFPGDSWLDEAGSILLRDVLMILLVGFWFVLYYVIIYKKDSLKILGFHKEKLKLSLILNVIFAIGLLCIFLKESGSLDFNYGALCGIVYIFAAGIFEMVFIYGFLRHYLKEAFGIIPSIILTAIFYSLHHAGFQPEFLDLFFVGIMYTSVIYITKNIFIIFPFFWGIGATWDVLVDSVAGDEIKNTTSLLVAIGVLVGMTIISLCIKAKVTKCKSGGTYLTATAKEEA